MLKPYVSSTPELPPAQAAIARAYLVLFGRSPDSAGLAWWAAQLGADVSLARAIDVIAEAVDASLILDPDPGAAVARMFHHLVGKVPAEDLQGQAYWAGRLRSARETQGQVAAALLHAAAGAPGFHGSTLRQRLEVLESICRLQRAHVRDLTLQTSRASVLRVDGQAGSFEAAMAHVHHRLVANRPFQPVSWGEALTETSFLQQSRSVANSPVREHRRLVWFNRSGEMMLATACLPQAFESTPRHRGIVGLHGGGWRQGYPEVLHGWATPLAATGPDPSYLVLCPMYRLTAHGYRSPQPQEDVLDFVDLLASPASAFLKLACGASGLFGESAGGHLACLVGALADVPRVLALYPPIDLRGDPAVSAALQPYVDHYAPGAAERAAASANLAWRAGRRTVFQLWHGRGDALVPPAQSAAFQATAGEACSVVLLEGEGHGFSAAAWADVVSSAAHFFDERRRVGPAWALSGR